MLKQPNPERMKTNPPIGGAVTNYGRGIEKGNPKICLICLKPIRAGEAWEKHTSAADPEFGRYSVIVHARCAAQR